MNDFGLAHHWQYHHHRSQSPPSLPFVFQQNASRTGLQWHLRVARTKQLCRATRPPSLSGADATHDSASDIRTHPRHTAATKPVLGVPSEFRYDQCAYTDDLYPPEGVTSTRRPFTATPELTCNGSSSLSVSRLQPSGTSVYAYRYGHSGLALRIDCAGKRVLSTHSPVHQVALANTGDDDPHAHLLLARTAADILYTPFIDALALDQDDDDIDDDEDDLDGFIEREPPTTVDRVDFSSRLHCPHTPTFMLQHPYFKQQLLYTDIHSQLVCHDLSTGDAVWEHISPDRRHMWKQIDAGTTPQSFLVSSFREVALLDARVTNTYSLTTLFKPEKEFIYCVRRHETKRHLFGVRTEQRVELRDARFPKRSLLSLTAYSSPTNDGHFSCYLDFVKINKTDFIVSLNGRSGVGAVLYPVDEHLSSIVPGSSMWRSLDVPMRFPSPRGSVSQAELAHDFGVIAETKEITPLVTGFHVETQTNGDITTWWQYDDGCVFQSQHHVHDGRFNIEPSASPDDSAVKLLPSKVKIHPECFKKAYRAPASEWHEFEGEAADDMQGTEELAATVTDDQVSMLPLADFLQKMESLTTHADFVFANGHGTAVSSDVGRAGGSLPHVRHDDTHVDDDLIIIGGPTSTMAGPTPAEPALQPPLTPQRQQEMRSSAGERPPPSSSSARKRKKGFR